MKIRLLNDGGYCGFEKVTFPVEVDATRTRGGNYDVSEVELARIGADMDVVSDPDDPMWPFTNESVEVI